MAETRILTEAELRQTVELDLGAVDVVEAAFAGLATGGVVMPPVLSMTLAAIGGEVDVKTAYVPGLPRFAVKISPGFFGNAALGLPSLNGLMVVLSARTGMVEAVLLDNGYLTDVRTAAAGAVAARHLAPPEIRTAAVLGTGMQAGLQMQALHLVRPFGEVLVWGRDKARAAALAERLTVELGVAAQAVSDPADAVRRAQVVVTTTPAETPILRTDWLHPGLHITAMGSDNATKNEIEPAALAAATLYVCDSVAQCATLGELRAARALGLIAADPPTLGQVVTESIPGRRGAEDITICDLTGTGVQDTAIAHQAIETASAAGIGTMIKT
ncbi:MAG: cyclodeaminase [Pseudomonadota bacterium]